MSHIYQHLLKHNIQKDLTLALKKPSKTLYVSPNGNDVIGNGSISNPFKTIGKGITEANLLAFSGESITVWVESGHYFENTISLASNVSIFGESQEGVIISPNDPNSVLFELGDLTSISFVKIIDVTGNTAVSVDSAEAYAILHKVYLINNFSSIRVDSTLADSFVYLEYVSIDDPTFVGIEAYSSSGNTTELSIENTYIYNVESQASYCNVLSNGENVFVSFHTGSLINQFSVGSGYGFYSVNGGDYRIRNVQIEGFEWGIYMGSGTSPELEAATCTFRYNIYNFYVFEPSTTGNFSGYTDYDKFFIDSSSTFFITNTDSQVLTVAKKGGNFTSIKDAIDSISDNSVTKVYTIKVGSGVFIEDTIQMKSYVNVVGESITSTIIEVDSTAKDVILATGNSGLFRLQLRGATNSGKCAIIFNGGSGVFRCNEVRFGSNYCFYKQNSTSGSAVSIFNGCSAEATSNFTQAFEIISNGATPSTFAFNTFVYTGNGANFLKVYGTAAQISAANLTVVKTVLLGYGIHAYNGATVSLNSVTLSGFNTAVYNENTGAGISIYTGAFSLRANTIDIQIDHPSTTGSIFGFFTKDKISVNANSAISLLMTDITGEGTVSLGDLWMGNKFSDIYNIKPLIEAQTLGLVEGGELSDGGGFIVNVASGVGYVEDASVPPDIYKRFDWTGDSIALSANQDVYIFYNTNGILTSNASRPSTIANIILGRVVTTGVGIKYIEQAKFDAHHTANKISKAMRNIFGPIFADGSGLTYSNSSRQIEVLGGQYYLGEIEVNFNGKIFTDNFIPIYRGLAPNTWIEGAATNTIDNTLYDDNSGTLASVPLLTPFVKHTLFVTNDGVNDKYYLVVGQDVFATENDAATSPNSLYPTWFREQTVVVAGIITDATTGTTASVYDLRPRPSFVPGVGASVTSHSSLSDLSADDHPQYILVDGTRPFTGNLDLGGNNLTNVNLVDGVDVSNHASRHLPNGADALTTAAPTTNLGGSSTNSVGIANSYSRSDHSHAIDIASSGQTGLLNSTDWNTFNSKANTSDVFLNGQFDYSKLPSYEIENFVENTTGFVIGFASSTASGGSVASEVPEQQSNWNSASAIARLGQSSVRITTANNSRAAIATNANYRLFTTVKFMFSAELSFVGGQVDFTNDPVLHCWGFLNSFATATPSTGIYFRPPRTSETSFLKYVILVAGAESIFDTTIPYDSTSRRFVKGMIDWNGLDLTFISTDGTTTSTNTISNFLVTYPTLATVNFSFGILNARNGVGAVAVARNINVDKVERYISNNF
jgi:hypothetical protein